MSKTKSWNRKEAHKQAEYFLKASLASSIILSRTVPIWNSAVRLVEDTWHGEIFFLTEPEEAAEDAHQLYHAIERIAPTVFAYSGNSALQISTGRFKGIDMVAVTGPYERWQELEAGATEEIIRLKKAGKHPLDNARKTAYTLGKNILIN